MALQSKAGQVLVGAQEGFLADVLRIVLRSGHMKGQPEKRLVATPHQLLESGRVAALRLANQHKVVRARGVVGMLAPPGCKGSRRASQRRTLSVLAIRYEHFSGPKPSELCLAQTAHDHQR